jgi:hypothetical protein
MLEIEFKYSIEKILFIFDSVSSNSTSFGETYSSDSIFKIKRVKKQFDSHISIKERGKNFEE